MASTTTRTFARAALRSTPARTAASALARQAFRQQSRRGYSSEGSAAPTASGGSALYWLGGLLGAAGAGYYVYGQQNGFSAAAKGPFQPTFEDYQKVYNEIAARLEEKDDYDDGSYGPVLLRLAWHASGTYDVETKTGGSNGATMRFQPEGDHGANAGLKAARDFLEPVKEKFPWITYSDLWILAGVTAIQEMQGPTIPYRPGRTDKDVAACTPDGRLPDATQGHKHLRSIFGRMGFNDQEIPDSRGDRVLELLLEQTWQWKKWKGPAQYEDKATKTLMMLPTDYVLIKDKGFRPWVEKYAKDNDLFFKDFSAVVTRLFELGVPFKEDTPKYEFKPTNA
ncbi:hypothetical protein VE04_08891 [Pseudogymnoascus sp. 24MN13]|nr:hypothetical protein VE04_08891 [Pseudogymnoascus sp. 24MN13]